MFILLACDNSSVLNTILFIKHLIDIIFIVAPIVLVLLLTIDIAKNVINKDDSENKRNVNIAIKRVVYCLALFFVPLIIDGVMSYLDNYNVNFATCYEKATEENVQKYYNEENKRYEEKEAEINKEKELNASKVANEKLIEQEAAKDAAKRAAQKVTDAAKSTAKAITDSDISNASSWSEKIALTAEKLAWPLGSPKSNHKEKGGSPTPAYKEALAKTIKFPKNQLKYKYTKGVSCSVYVSTVVRSSGYDKSFPYSVAGANSHASGSKKWKKVSPSDAVRGDIFAFKNNNHILIYGGKKGSKYLWYQANLGRKSHNGDYGYAFYDSAPSKKTNCNVWHATGVQ